MKRLHLMLTFVLVAGLLLACGGGEAPTPTPVVQSTEAKAPAAAPTTPQPPAVEPTEAKAAEVLPTPVPPTDTPAPPTPEVKPEAAEEELLANAEAALEALSKLKSFRSHTHFAWVSQEEGEEKESGEFEMRGEYVAEPPSQHTVITSSGDAAMGEESETFEIIQIEDQMWFRLEEDQWMQVGQQEFLPSFLMSAEEFLRDLSGARRLWPDETVNGIRCRHYRFTEKEMLSFFGMGELSKAEGELWVADKGDFVAKYTLHAEGKGLGLGETLGYGTMDMLYEISDVGAKIVIEPPAGGEAAIAGFAAGEFPLPEDAEMSMSSPGFSIFVTALPVAEVLEFYEARLAKLGWSKGDETIFGDFASLSFSKGAQQVDLMISADEESGKTQIMVTSPEG